jgi:hypothetical protein
MEKFVEGSSFRFLMSLLSAGLREEIHNAYGGEAPLTDLEFVRFNTDRLRGGGHRSIESLGAMKSHIFANSPDRFEAAHLLEAPEPLSTSLDRLFGGPLRRGEVTSIEGGSGSGKTRLVLKIAHDISVAGKVLFVDADLCLQPNILTAIEVSLGLENIVPPSFSIEDESNFTILPINSLLDLYTAINAYLTSNRPDLIIIDSLMSLFQNIMVNDGPGSAMLQQTALELKRLARDVNCVIVVTNVLKHDSHPPQPFLGRLYTSLGHQRFLMTTKNYLVAKVELVQSPRYGYRSGKIMIENLIDCPPDEIAALEVIE